MFALSLPISTKNDKILMFSGTYGEGVWVESPEQALQGESGPLGPLL